MAFPYKINEISCFYGESRFLMLNHIGKDMNVQRMFILLSEREFFKFPV